MIGWIDHLRGHGWPFYVVGIMAVALIENAVFWIDGSTPFGSFDPLTTIFAVFVFYWIALYQYLTRVASRSLKRFRPLLELGDSEFADLDYELATLPARLGALAIPLGLISAAATIVGDPAPYGDIHPRTILPYAGDIIVTGFLVATFYCLAIRSIRQLLQVSKLHARATDINLLKLEPAHAFSSLTARTGIGLILVLIFGFLLKPVEAGTAFDALLSIVTALLAIAVFVIPIMGMQDRLEEEKERVLNKNSDLLRSASDSVHNKVTNNDYHDMKESEAAIAALIRERELLSKVSTWPWDPRAIRSFGSALLLPILLWVVTRLLERLV